MPATDHYISLNLNGLYDLPEDLAFVQVTLVHPNENDQTFVAQRAERSTGLIEFQGPLDPRGLDDGVAVVRLLVGTNLNKKTHLEYRPEQVGITAWEVGEEIEEEV